MRKNAGGHIKYLPVGVHNPVKVLTDVLAVVVVLALVVTGGDGLTLDRLTEGKEVRCLLHLQHEVPRVNIIKGESHNLLPEPEEQSKCSVRDRALPQVIYPGVRLLSPVLWYKLSQRHVVQAEVRGVGSALEVEICGVRPGQEIHADQQLLTYPIRGVHIRAEQVEVLILIPGQSSLRKKYNIPPNLRVDSEAYLAHEPDGGTSLDHEAQPVGGVKIEAGEVEQLSRSGPGLLSLGNSYKQMITRF